MELNRATIEEFESIIAFYDDVTDRIALIWRALPVGLQTCYS